MGDFASDLLPSLDEIRSISGDLGLRPFTVELRVRTWSGPRSGHGLPSIESTTLTNADQPVMVTQIATKDIIASGGQLTDRDFKVGPMTPAYAASLDAFAGGSTSASLDPPLPATPMSVDVQWVVAGPGIPVGGLVFDKIGQESTALHFFITLRSTGRAPT